MLQRQVGEKGCIGTNLVFLKFGKFSPKEHRYIIKLFFYINIIKSQQNQEIPYSGEKQKYTLTIERYPSKLLREMQINYLTECILSQC